MKRHYYYTFVIPFLLITLGTNPSAQVPCISCPSDTTVTDAIRHGVRQAAAPFRDSIFSRLAKINEKQDSLVTAVDKALKGRIEIRSEYITLYPRVSWRYDWYYRNGVFFKLHKKQL